MDEMTIMKDGKPAFKLDGDNNIIDLRDHCVCIGEGRPEQRDGEQRTCLICGLPITIESD